MFDAASSIDRFPQHIRDAIPPATVQDMVGLIDEMMGVETALRADRAYRTMTEYLAIFRVDLVERLLVPFCRSPMCDIAREMLPGDPVFLLHHCIVRRYDQSVAGTSSPWHLDAEFLGRKHPAVNFWIPLSDVGEHRPGLTFATEPSIATEAVETWVQAVTGSPDPAAALGEGRRALHAILEPAAQVSPVLRAGEALLFDQVVPHKTQRIEGPAEMRYSMEIRIAGSDGIPSGYDESNLPVAQLLDGPRDRPRFRYARGRDLAS